MLNNFVSDFPKKEMCHKNPKSLAPFNFQSAQVISNGHDEYSIGNNVYVFSVCINFPAGN